MIIEQIHQAIEARHLLKHPYYQMWNEGKLNQEILADYAKEYYLHVKAFPRYLTQIHTQCDDIEARQVLLENLIEEERGEENHPKLWRDFALELGNNESTIENAAEYDSTKALVNKFFELCKKSYASGLGALYTYEHQTPAVAKTKIKGLNDFYNMTSEKALKFFEVHEKADEWHSDEVAGLIKKLSPEEQIEACEAAKEAAEALWGFLDGMMVAHNLKHECAC